MIDNGNFLHNTLSSTAGAELEGFTIIVFLVSDLFISSVHHNCMLGTNQLSFNIHWCILLHSDWSYILQTFESYSSIDYTQNYILNIKTYMTEEKY